ncbi:MAG TPA: MBL fold metallo-hydrolase [Terriglobales bacterium]|nr:MBL fold metallo-hydrolase [Terriglobales bacterium]
MRIAPLIAVSVVMLGAAPTRGQIGQVDYSRAKATITPVRGNVYLLQVRTPKEDKEDICNLGLLAGPDGYLLVDHPEPTSGPEIRRALDEFAKQRGEQPLRVKFLIDTHWHYDHVGGNELYGPETVIVAHENVRKRLMTQQKPWWSPTPIGPYPEGAWPRVTYGDSLMIHLDGEDAELVHYGNAHTDGDTVVWYERANAANLGDLFEGKDELSVGADMEGMASVLGKVLERSNDQTLLITGHGGALSTRRDLEEYVAALNDTIFRVKQEIAAGESLKKIQDEGLPEKWKEWKSAAGSGFPPDVWIKLIYMSLTKKDLDQ